jgi:HEAT repeat protein
MTITPESVQTLLKSTDLGDRLRAVNQLRQLDQAIAFELVQIAAKDSNPRVRYAAISQFDTLGDIDLDLSLEILRDHLLHDPEIDVQAAAADSLGGLKLTAAFDDLIYVYRTSPEWLVQFSIIAILGEMGEPRAFDILAEALNSPNELVQSSAISSLGELGDPRSVDLLSPFVTNSDWQVRYRLAQALTRLGGEQARSLLETLSQDEFEQVANEAKAGL